MNQDYQYYTVDFSAGNTMVVVAASQKEASRVSSDLLTGQFDIGRDRESRDTDFKVRPSTPEEISALRLPPIPGGHTHFPEYNEENLKLRGVEESLTELALMAAGDVGKDATNADYATMQQARNHIGAFMPAVRAAAERIDASFAARRAGDYFPDWNTQQKNNENISQLYRDVANAARQCGTFAEINHRFADAAATQSLHAAPLAPNEIAEKLMKLKTIGNHTSMYDEQGILREYAQQLAPAIATVHKMQPAQARAIIDVYLSKAGIPVPRLATAPRVDLPSTSPTVRLAV